MSSPPRLREHPQSRFSGPEHLLDLPRAAAELRSEPHAAVAGHRQLALFRHGPLTLVLFAFEESAVLKEHRTDGLTTIHVLKGRLDVETPSGTHALAAGQILILAPGTVHSVLAPEPSEMLLTICLE